jgi:ubiquinone/menaquinone biosynthesis C-methylase UbiE
LFVLLTGVAPAIKQRLWNAWYGWLARHDPRAQLRFMNYGFMPAVADTGLALSPEDEPFRYPIELYRHVVQGVTLTGKDVLEVGSGRGGGADFLARHYRPASVLGVEAAEDAVRFCQQSYREANLQFRQGLAEALPCAEASVDVVVNVESSHCYADVAKFLSEVRRVLRPGGYFCFCDLRTRAGMMRLRQQLNESDLKWVSIEDITPEVVRALEAMAQERAQLLRGVPSWLRRAYAEFIGLAGSRSHRLLATGELQYCLARLQRL